MIRISFRAALPIFIFLILLPSLFAGAILGESGLVISPSTVQVHQPVTIEISQPENKSLVIISPDAAFRYQGKLPSSISFTPKSKGNYLVRLISGGRVLLQAGFVVKEEDAGAERGSGTFADGNSSSDESSGTLSNNTTFNGTTGGTNEGSQDNDEYNDSDFNAESGASGASGSSGAGDSLRISTEKEIYVLGETATIIVTTPSPSKTRLIIKTPEEELRYMGSLPGRVSFTPSISGRYVLKLLLDGIERQTDFVVLNPPDNTSGDLNGSLSASGGSVSGGSVPDGSFFGSPFSDGPFSDGSLINGSLMNNSNLLNNSETIETEDWNFSEGGGENFSNLFLNEDWEVRRKYVRAPSYFAAVVKNNAQTKTSLTSENNVRPAFERAVRGDMPRPERRTLVSPVAGQKYDAFITSERGAFKELELRNYTYQPGEGPLIDEEPFIAVPLGERLVNTLVIDLSGLNMTNATLVRSAKGRALYKCPAWDFTKRACAGSWQFIRKLTPGEAYTLTLTPEDPAFGEDVSWWNLSYQYRRQLNITGTISTNQELSLVLDTRTLINDSKLQSDADDLRILWYNDSSGNWTELNREVVGVNETTTRVWFRAVNDSTNSYDYFLYYGNPSSSNPPNTPDIALNFSIYNVSDYGGSLQNPDTNSWEINDSGLTFHQYGNNWKAINKSYTVTSATVLEFDFRNRYNGTNEQEINGVGFDTQLSSLTSSTFFQTYGTQTSFGIQTYDDYASSPNWKHYTINVSASMSTGSYTYLTFSSDEDSSPGVPDGWYRGVVLREKSNPDPSITLGLENAIDINKPYVTLKAPANNSLLQTSSATLNCSARSLNGQDIVNVTLYTNRTGTWQAEQTTSYSGSNDTLVNASFTLSLSDGSYHWNCLAWNNESNSSFSAYNYTLIIDTRTLSISEDLNPSFVGAGDNVTVTGCSALNDGTNASNTPLSFSLDNNLLNTSTITGDGIHSPSWWNYSWHYRIPLNASVPSLNSPAVVTLNFTKILADYGVSSQLDNNSLRLIEYNSGVLIGEREVQFAPASDYALGNEVGDVIWIPLSTGNKTYELYFDTLSNGPKPDPNAPSFRLYANSFEDANTFTSYTGSAGSQDTNPNANRYNTTTVYHQNRSWEIYQNSWKELSLPSSIQLTENTTMTVAVYITIDTEIQGIGLDNSADNTASTELDYNLAGCQWSGGSCGDWADDNEDYHATGLNNVWRSLSLPVGADYYAKSGSYDAVDQIIFIDDDDSSYGGSILYDAVAIWSVNVTNETSTTSTGNAETLLMTDDSGCYNFTFSAPSSQGSHTLAVNITYSGKSAGNQSTFTVDSSAPTVTLLSPNNGGTETMPNVTFEWRADDLQSWVSCDLIIDGATYLSNINSTTGTTTSRSIDGFDSGTYNWSVACTDSLNQQGSSAVWNFSVNLSTILYISTNGTTFTNGTIINVSLNLTDQSGNPVSNANITTRFLRAELEYDWWNTTWKYRKPFVVAADSNLDEYVFNLTLDTATLISEGKMASDCSGLRVLNASENELPFWIDPSFPCNESKTRVWVKSALNTTGTVIFLYYGANTTVPSVEDEEAVFSYGAEKGLLYVVDSFTATTGTTSVVAFYNNTHVTAGSTTLTLNQGEVGTIANAQLTQGSPITADKPVYAAHDGTSDALVPLSFAGTSFVYRIDRGSGTDYNEFFVVAPFGAANVSFYYGSPPANYENLTVSAGGMASTSIDVPDNTGVIIESTAPVLIFHASATNANDAFSLYPATTDWVGVPSTNLQIAALEDGTSINLYWSDTSSPTTISLDAGEEYGPTGYGADGTAAAVHIVASKPVGVSQLADSDGTEATTFLPESELSTEYFFPHDTAYVAIATIQSGTNCTLYNSTGGVLYSASNTSTDPYPAKLYYGTDEGATIPPGSRLLCTKPVFAYAEYDNGGSGGQEQNLWGVKQFRTGNATLSTTPYGEEEYLYTDINATDANGSLILPYDSGLYGFGTYFAWAESQPSLVSSTPVSSGDVESGTSSASGAGPTVIGEAGSFSSANFSFQEIQFQNRYSQTPLVLMTPASQNQPAVQDDSALIPVVANINTTSMNVSLCMDNGTATCPTSGMAAETVDYFIFDHSYASTYSWMDMGSQSSVSMNGADTNFNFAKTFANAPAVFTTPQTYNQVNGELGGIAWVDSATTTTTASTLIGCTHQGTGNSCDTSTPSEDIGWVALDLPNVAINGLQYGSSDISNSAWTPASFSPSFTNPVVMVTQNDDDGGQDPQYAWARALTGTGMDFRYCEQDGADYCDSHTGEVVDWFALEAGDITVGSEQVEYNTSYTTYDDVIATPASSITLINVSINISSYNNSASVQKGNTAPDVSLELYDGSGWTIIGVFNVTSTGTYTLTTNDSSLLSAWTTASNRDARVRGIYMDWVNDSFLDRISWNRFTVVMTVQKESGVAENHTSWKVIDNSPPLVTNLSASPDPVGFGYSTNLSALVTDETGVASVRFNITTPNGSLLSVTPTLGSDNYYWYLFNDTWTYGYHNFLVWAEDVSGQVSTRNITFFVGADAAISVKVENETYGSNQDVYLIGEENNSDWWNQNYLKRRNLTITETSGSDLGEYQVNLTIDTASLISSGQLRGDCADIRFTDANKTPLSFYRVDIPRFACNTSQTLFYVKMNLSANENKSIWMYYDYDGASDGSSDKETFSFSEPVALYYVVSNRTPLGNIDVVSIGDNNTITHNGASLSLNESQIGSFTSVLQGANISAPRAFYATGDADGTDSVAPLQFAAKEFAVASMRGVDQWSIYAPVADATVCFYNSDGATLTLIDTCVSVTRGSVSNVERDLNSLSSSNSYGGYINSTAPVIITHYAVTGSTIQDSFVLPPPGTEIYGVPGTRFLLAALEDNTQVTVYMSNGTSYTRTLNKGQGYYENNAQYYGAGPAYLVSADKPVFASQVADGNGNEATIFLPDTLLSKTYYMANGYDYLALASPEETTCTRYDRYGNYIDQQSSTGQDLPYPHHLLFSGRTSGDGDRVVCTKPVWAAYQYATTDDERNAFGLALYRQYATSTPSVAFGAVEEAPGESTLKNLGSYAFKGSLVMQVDHLDNGSWTRVGVPVVDDLATSTIRTFSSGSTLWLNQTWKDNGAWNTQLYDAGTYRVTAQLFSPDGAPLNLSTITYFAAHDQFLILAPNLTIQELTHENLYEHGVNEYEVGDTLAWVNVTARNENATALNLDMTLSVLNPDETPASWGPWETQSCGDLAPNETCTKQWNNASGGGAGYPIPLDASTGTYTMLWNLLFTGDNFASFAEKNETFKLFDLRSRFSSTLSPSTINRNDSSTYQFGMENLFSANLTGVNVTINCPSVSGISCSCINGTGETCNLSQLASTSGVSWWNQTYAYRRPFNVTNNEASTLSSGYTTSIDVDTASLIASGKAQLDCDDIRVVFTNASGSDVEIDRELTDCNSAASTITFATQQDISSGASDGNYTIYYGNPSATSPPTNLSNVYFFYDDFEDGDIDGWSQYSSGTVQYANVAGNGVILKTANNDPNGGYAIFPGSLSDFEVTYIFNRPNENGGQQSRYGVENSGFSGYGLQVTDVNPSGTFAIEERSGGSSAGTIASTSTSYFALNTWYSIKQWKLGTTHNITVYNSTGGYLDSLQGTDASVNSGFDRFVIHGGYEFYTDDIKVRRLVANEPTSALGVEEDRDVLLTSAWFPEFNITTNASTPLGNYLLSVNVTYINPGGEVKLWTSQEPQLLKVSAPNIITSTIVSNYTNVTRTVGFAWAGFANNTNGADATNAALEWFYPYGWSVLQGSKQTTDPVLTSGELLWNNATLVANASAALGVQQLNLTSNSSNVEGETDAVLVEVWAAINATLALSPNSTDRGEEVLLNATILLDNGTPLDGRTVTFRDLTDNVTIGTNTTDVNGWVHYLYTLPSDASVGNHTIVAETASEPSRYYSAGSANATLVLTAATTFNSLFVTPSPVGLGVPAVINANISDGDGIANVTANVTLPNGTSYIVALSLAAGSSTEGLYQGSLNDTWIVGQYNYSVSATDNNSVSTTSTNETFTVAADASLTIETQFSNYSQNEQVNLSGFETWWNTSYLYRQPFNLSTDYSGTVPSGTSLKVVLDTAALVSAHKMNSNASDLRVVWYNNATGTFTELSRIVLDENTNETTVWFLSPTSFTNNLTGLSIYYGNPSAPAPLENIKPFTYYTRMDGGTVNGNGGDLILIPYFNNTNYTISGGVSASGTLNEGETYQNFALPSTDQTYTIQSSKPLSVYTGVLEGSNPNAWTTALDQHGLAAGREFRVWGFSSSGNPGIGALWIIAPESSTNYQIRDASTSSLLANGTLSTGGLLKYTTGSNQTLVVTADRNVIVATGKADTPASRDAQRWWAAADGSRLATTLWGVSSNNDGLRIYNPNSYSVTVNLTDMTDGTDTITLLAVGARSTLFQALSTNDHVIRVDASAPVLVDDKYLGGTNRQADSGDYVPDADTGAFVGTRFYVHATGSASSDEKGMVWALFDNTNVEMNGASLATLNSGNSYAFNPPVDATVNVTADKPVLFLFFTEEGGTDYSFAVPPLAESWSGLPSTSFGAEESTRSRILEAGGVPFRGALQLWVEQNRSEGWTFVESVVDDLANSTIRNISAYRLLDLAQAWLDEGAWNTLTREDGLYRVVARFVDPSGNVLVTTDNTSLSGSANFTILPARVNLDMENIKIYDVTGLSGSARLTDTSNLSDSGLNKTFILFYNHTYRVEIVVDTLANSDNWSINESNVTHAGLDASWPFNTSEIRYLAGLDTYVGGSWSGGNVTWNTSQGGLILPSSSMTYEYVVNTSTSGTFPVHFVVDGPDFGEEDHSIFRLVPYESVPPRLSGPYNLTRLSLNRGESTTVYAQWNEEIRSALAEYNSTSSTLTNHSITLPSPNPGNWTNQTIATNGSWLPGAHAVKVYAYDLADNLNDTLSYLFFDVYELLHLSNITVSPNPLDLGNTTLVACRVMNDANESVSGYPVRFSNVSGELGTNTTNSTGWAVWHYTDSSPGTENLTCAVTANLSAYRNVTAPENLSVELTTKEYGIPYPTSIGQSATNIHKLENISFWAYWHDNYMLDSSLLQTEEYGSLTNSTLASPIVLNGTDDWANFTVQYPSDSLLGYQRWRIFGNDTSGNVNDTGFGVVYVWGWASITDYKLNPKSIIVGNWSVMECLVTDDATGNGVNGYTVSFYNSTGLLGTALTNATGWASYNFTDDTLGQETITCNITDSSSLYYNATNQSSASDTLNTLPPGSDITPPVALNYSIDPSSTLIGGNVTISARWDENISIATIFFNATSNAIESVNDTPPFPGNWTNHTFVTNSSWLLGTHVARIVAKDLMNNTNDTLSYLQFNVTSLSQVSWLSPTGDVPKSTIHLRCNVTDNITGQPIAGYPVYFYDGVGAVGSALSGSDGVATLDIDGSSYSGSESFTCRIFAQPDLYYALSGNFQDGATLFFDGQAPSVVLNWPGENETVRSSTVDFNFTATDSHASSLNCNLTIDGALNQTSISATSGVPTVVSVPNLAGGGHTWSVACADPAGNIGTSSTQNFTIVERDLSVNGSSITFNETSPEENETVRVFGTVWNLGGTNLTNVTVQLWLGDPDAGGVQLGSNFTVNVTALGNATVNATMNVSLGLNTVYIVVDPEDAIAEASETNNKAYGTVTVGLWNFFMGLTNDLRVVTDGGYKKLFVWNVSNATGSNIFVADSDSNIQFGQLQALGLDVNNNTVDDDFTELDVHMNTTSFSDSVEKTYTSAGSPRALRSFTVFRRAINSVPVVNSTNSSSFVTGILWDMSDGGQSYNGSQDVLFITELNKSTLGYNGVHDYEVRVPATLREYVGSTDTVTFYAEIKSD